MCAKHFNLADINRGITETISIILKTNLGANGYIPSFVPAVRSNSVCQQNGFEMLRTFFGIG